MTRDSSSKVAVVSGGTFGIGAGVSMALAKAGFHVVAFGLESPQPSSIAAQGGGALREWLRDSGLEADVLEADVSDRADVEAVMKTARRRGPIDVLVNNAAIGPLGSVLDTDEAVWDRVLSVNLKGAYLCARAALPSMIDRGRGSIINIGSGAGWGKANMAAYAASKGGLYALTMALAHDHFRDGVRVNMVIPGGGGIVTGMSVGRRLGARSDGAMAAPPTVGTVAGRPATPEDVAAAVRFLASDSAETISGTVIDVGCFSHQGGPVPPAAPNRASSPSASRASR